MRFTLMLLWLELKRMFKMLPKLLLGALALCAVLGCIALGAESILYKEQSMDKLKILVYVPKDDKYIDMMMGIVENIKSVESLCDFQYAENREEIYNSVKNGDAYAGVIFPMNFVQSIVRGYNYAATVVVPEGTVANSALFKELAEGGSGMLSAVQAGIYSFIDAYESENGKALNNDIIDAVNMEYVDFVLPREKYFKHELWSATGSLSAMEYYCVMAVTVFLMLFGMSCVRIVHTDYSAVYRLGAVKGFNGIFKFLIKHIVVFVLYCIMSVLIFAGLKAVGMDIEICPEILMGVWLASAVVTAFYIIIKNSVGAALCIFAYTMVTGLLSGSFLPVSFLPQTLRGLYAYMPTYYIVQCFNTGFGVKDINIMGYGIALAVIYTVALLVDYCVTGGEV